MLTNLKKFDYVIADKFKNIYEVWCKDEGRDSTTYANKSEALRACFDNDKCSSVVTDDCSEPKKFQLCNGLEFERRGGDDDCAVGWRKKCKSP